MFTSPSPTLILALLGTGVILLLYGVRLITDAFQRATDIRVQRLLTRLTGHRLAAFGVGALTTALIQSSNAMASLLVTLVSANLIPLTTAMLLLLGANVGATLVVQLLTLHITNYAIELLGLGALVALFTRGTSFNRLGQACLAFGLIVMGLFTISQGSQPIATSPLTATVLQALASAPFVLLLIGTLLAMLLSSATAPIGLVLVLVEARALPMIAALALVLGANVGTTLMPLIASLQPGTIAGRRLALIHMGTKLTGAMVLLFLLDPLITLLARTGFSLGTQVALVHLGFNVALALVFGPLVTPIARLTEKLLPEPAGLQGNPAGPHYLDPRSLVQPPIALGQAMRETLRIAAIMTDMLEKSLDTFEDGTRDHSASIEVLGDQVGKLTTSVRIYLSQLDETRLTEAQARQELALLSILTDLEAIGHTVSRRLMRLVRRRNRDASLLFQKGQEDLLTYHQEILEAFQQIVAALATREPEIVEAFLARNKARSQLKRALYLRYIHRLYAGSPLSLVSNSTQLDLLNTMGEVLSHITSVACTLQESNAPQKRRVTSGALPVVTILPDTSVHERFFVKVPGRERV